MSTIRNVILLVLLLGAGIAGYFIGAQSGKSAKEALAKLEAETKAAESEHQKATTELKAQVATLTSNYEAQKKQINADYSAKHEKLSALLFQRDRDIADLKKRGTADIGEISQLRAHLNDPQTSQEKQAKLDRIAKLENDALAAKLALRGEFCLKVPVPKEILATLQEGKS